MTLLGTGLTSGLCQNADSESAGLGVGLKLCISDRFLNVHLYGKALGHGCSVSLESDLWLTPRGLPIAGWVILGKSLYLSEHHFLNCGYYVSQVKWRVTMGQWLPGAWQHYYYCYFYFSYVKSNTNSTNTENVTCSYWQREHIFSIAPSIVPAI